MTNLRSLCLDQFCIDPLNSLSQLVHLTHLEFHRLSEPGPDSEASCPWLSTLTNLHHLGLHSSELIRAGALTGLACLTQLASLSLCVALSQHREAPFVQMLRKSKLSRAQRVMLCQLAQARLDASNSVADGLVLDQVASLSALTGLTQLQLQGCMPISNRQSMGSMLAPLSSLPLRVLRIWQDEEEHMDDDEQLTNFPAQHLSSAAMAGRLPAHMLRALVNAGLKYDMGGEAYLRL